MMQVRLIEENFDPRYPYALCNSDGIVVARFKTEEEAKSWATRNRLEVITDTFPNYTD